MTVVRGILGSKAMFAVLLALVLAVIASALVTIIGTWTSSDRTVVDGIEADRGNYIYSHATYAINPDDERQLVGNSDHVFVGRVVNRVGEAKANSSAPDVYGAPTTQYAVEVRQVVKGSLPVGSTVTVSQDSGYDRNLNKNVVAEGDEPLRPQRDYAF